MSYLHIPNLYRDQRILAFRQCYALEKVHGTSAHLTWRTGHLTYSPGGASTATFLAAFNVQALPVAFHRLGYANCVVYGEAYGGKEQGMRDTYGPDLRFIVFDVAVDDVWLDVPTAERAATDLGLEFVPYEAGPTDLAWLNEQRDRPSRVAARRGIHGKPAEGVVLRPVFECNAGEERVIAKHKRDAFRETTTPPVVDPAQQVVLADAEAIALEWVTDMRLAHVLDKLRVQSTDLRVTSAVAAAVLEDIQREATGEITWSPAAEKAVRRRTADLFKARVRVKRLLTLGRDTGLKL